MPAWILRFRDLPCLPDTLGRPRHSAELLLRTPETEPLINLESFVQAGLDTEATRPLLLLLKVSDKPTGPERLLERLRALAGSETPLVHEVRKWCYSLDQLFDRCSSTDVQAIKTAFAASKLILTDCEEWASADEIFLNPDQDGLLETALIHPALRELTIWRKIGVAEYPTEEMEIEWLKSLPPGEKLTPTQTRRIKHLLGPLSRPRLARVRPLVEPCGGLGSCQQPGVLPDDAVARFVEPPLSGSEGNHGRFTAIVFSGLSEYPVFYFAAAGRCN